MTLTTRYVRGRCTDRDQDAGAKTGLDLDQIADKIAMKFSANCELQVNLKDLHQALLEFSSKYQHYENLYFTKINNPVAITQAKKNNNLITLTIHCVFLWVCALADLLMLC